MGEYDLDTFGQLINDPVRTGAYAKALERAVRPGATVLDIGTGTGILALLACRCGARLVHAVELDPVIDVARQVAAANGLQDRIVFHAVDSTRLELPERVDVVVSDIYGVLPFHRRRIPVLADARERHLAPGGAMIPRRDRLWVAPVSAPAMHAVVTRPWTDNAYGFDMRAARDIAANQWRRVEFSPEHLAAAPLLAADLDHTRPVPPHLDVTLRSPITRAAELHGFAAWFDAELGDGIGFSAAPGGAAIIYGNAFFAWPEPVAAKAGDVARIRLRATLSGSQYVWAWQSDLLDGGDEARPRAAFRQSTFLGMDLAPESLAKVSAERVGALNPEGELALAVLEGLARGETLGDIATRLHATHPGRFAGEGEALAQVSRISVRYGR